MPKKTTGGTKMFCPKCKADTYCAAIPLYHIPQNKVGQRKHTKGEADIPHFERLRKCRTCGEEFETVELEIHFLWELIKLRDYVRKVRDGAEPLIRLQSS